MNTIICGDCIEVMKGWPDKSVDVVITDPPWPNCKLWKDAEKIFAEAAKQIERICHRALIILGYGTNPGLLHWLNMPFIRVCNMRYQKPNYAGRLLGGNDYVYVFGNLPKPIEGRHILGGECTVSVSHAKRETDHPCERSMIQMLWCIKNWTDENENILDPFCGSGTICVAAKKFSRRFIGIDISPEYCEMARKRLISVDTGVSYAEAKQGQKAMFE